MFLQIWKSRSTEGPPFRRRFCPAVVSQPGKKIVPSVPKSLCFEKLFRGISFSWFRVSWMDMMNCSENTSRIPQRIAGTGWHGQLVARAGGKRSSSCASHTGNELPWPPGTSRYILSRGDMVDCGSNFGCGSPALCLCGSVKKPCRSGAD